MAQKIKHFPSTEALQLLQLACAELRRAIRLFFSLSAYQESSSSFTVCADMLLNVELARSSNS
jgi:hypothetical protein